MRRSRATTSWEVSPAGLSISSTPSMKPNRSGERSSAGRGVDGFGERGGEGVPDRRQLTGDGAAGGIAVPAARPARGDRADVDLALRAQADPPGAVGLTLDERDGFDLARAERQVHEPFGVVGRGPAPGEQRVVV